MKASTEEEEGSNGIDRINPLPICLLHHILSFLPTKTCVRTISLVSPKWRYLWKDLQVFDFHDHSFLDDTYNGGNAENFPLFTVFVNTVLSRRNSNAVRKFRLSSIRFQPDMFSIYSVHSWIGTAVGPNLQEFYLNLPNGFNNLPLTLFSCPNLVSLSLNGNILLQLQDSSQICLPSLKVLQLLAMGDLDMNSVNILLSGCPILEILELDFDSESLDKLQVPFSLSLKTLIVEVNNDDGNCLEINAPGLKHLNISMVTLGIVVANLHNVEEAYLDLLYTSESKSAEPLLILLRAPPELNI